MFTGLRNGYSQMVVCLQSLARTRISSWDLSLLYDSREALQIFLLDLDVSIPSSFIKINLIRILKPKLPTF